MKPAIWLLSVTVLFFFTLSFAFWVFSPAFSKEPQDVVSPLPSYLSLPKNNQVRILDFWKPFIETFGGETELAPTTKAALLFDLSSGKTLFEKEATTRLPMASLTKIMTAIVALENPKRDDRYLVKGADLVGEDSMGILPGEVFTLEELLYGLMLRSGNDAAEVLASNFPGGRDAFLRAMTQKAQALGLTDTKFSNPSGLQGDGEQYTTASDLLVMTRYALDNFPLFAKVAATFSHEIPSTSTHQSYYMENETNLLTSYPGVKGVKTGYTPEAGMCLVTYLEYDGHRIVGVLLNSGNRRQEMKDMLDYGLNELGTPPPDHS